MSTRLEARARHRLDAWPTGACARPYRVVEASRPSAQRPLAE